MTKSRKRRIQHLSGIVLGVSMLVFVDGMLGQSTLDIQLTLVVNYLAVTIPLAVFSYLLADLAFANRDSTGWGILTHLAEICSAVSAVFTILALYALFQHVSALGAKLFLFTSSIAAFLLVAILIIKNRSQSPKHKRKSKKRDDNDD